MLKTWGEVFAITIGVFIAIFGILAVLLNIVVAFCLVAILISSLIVPIPLSWDATILIEVLMLVISAMFAFVAAAGVLVCAIIHSIYGRY